MIIWPTRSTKFIDWADSLRLTRPDIEINPRIDNEKEWRKWASHLIQSQPCQNVNAPRPDNFARWENWADAFIKAFGTQA